MSQYVEVEINGASMSSYLDFSNFNALSEENKLELVVAIRVFQDLDNIDSIDTQVVEMIKSYKIIKLTGNHWQNLGNSISKQNSNKDEMLYT